MVSKRQDSTQSLKDNAGSSVQKTPSQKPFWVILGASAGGLEALKEFLGSIDPDLPATYIIAQHLDPKHPTILKDLLSRMTDLPISLIEEDLEPQVGRVYIVSPGHNALVKNQHVRLSPAAAIGPKPSISLLLNSVAEEIGDRAIAVILSGTGSDGAQGVTAIKAASGLVIAQDEHSAKYSGMPNAAIDTGFVDLVLTPNQIAVELKSYIESAGSLITKLSVPQAKSNLEKIFQRLLDQTGYDFSGYKLKTIQRRIARRMAVHKVVNLDDYVTLLSSSKEEIENLFKDLLISVTDFFRDPEAFKDLEQVIDKMVEANQEGEQIRIWVPGCANGEEPYSIAILFQQARLKYRKEINFQIFATDIDEFALSQARKAVYSETQVREIDPSLLKQYFHEKDGQYQIHKSIRDQVVFARQNLVMDPPFSRLDLISCRNVLIYFSLELQKQVFQTFHFSLKPNGYLFLGKSESTSSGAAQLFEPYNKRSQIYQRKKTNLSTKLDHVSSALSVARTKRHRDTGAPMMLQEKNQIVGQLDQVLLEQLVPVAVIVDSSGQVMHIRGDVGAYLSFPQGRIDTNILSLVRDDLKVDVRALLQKAKRDGQASTQALFYNNSEAENALFITVKRVEMETSAQEVFVFSFTQVDMREAFISGTGLLDQDSQITNDNLRKEVSVFKERLQTSIEELETTNEELQSTNEELQSANEELQSANEELQTANEEMQSTNEELSTVNQELEVKTYELEQVNNDLENMLAKMNEAIVLVDNRLRVQRYTKQASGLLGIESGSIGQTITTLGIQIDIPNLRQELLNVIESEIESHVRVRKGPMVYNLRLVPYKSDAIKVVGVMMFFESTSHTYQLNPAVDGHRNLALLGVHLPFGLIAIDQMGVMTYISEQARSMTGYDLSELDHQNVKMLMPDPYRQHHDGYVQHYLSGQTSGNIGSWRDVTLLTKSGERKLYKLRTEETWINAERHFLGYLKSPED